MSGFGTVVLWFVILAFILIRKGKRSEQNDNRSSRNRETGVPTTGSSAASQGTGYGTGTGQVHGRTTASRSGAGSGSGSFRNGTAAPVSGGVTDYHAGEIREDKKHHTGKSTSDSTTDYLRKKAEEDAAQHREEKARERLRAARETGGLPSAVRLYEGDSVPTGMRRVRCSYCAADNLVPENSRQRYTCYFCREELL